MNESTPKRPRRQHFIDSFQCVLDFAVAMIQRDDMNVFRIPFVLTAEELSDLHVALIHFEMTCPIGREV